MRAVFFLLSAWLLWGCPGGDVIGEEGKCLEERRCALDRQEVCGEDGKQYACASMARCEGVIVDPLGDACRLPPEPPLCEDELCPGVCPEGSEFKRGADGCLTCECEPVTCEQGDRFACPPHSVLVCDQQNGCDECRCEEVVSCPTNDSPECGEDEVLICSDEHGCQVCFCEESVRPCPDVEPSIICAEGFEAVCEQDGAGCAQCRCRESQCPLLAEDDICPPTTDAIVCEQGSDLACVWQETTRDARWQCVPVSCFGPGCADLIVPDCLEREVARCDDIDGDGCEECWCEVASCPIVDYPVCDGDGEVLAQGFDAEGCATYSCEVACQAQSCNRFEECPFGRASDASGCPTCDCRMTPRSCARDLDCDQGLRCTFDELDPEPCCLPWDDCEDLYRACVGVCAS